MKKNYLRIAALLAAVVSSTSAMAIDPPTIAQELVDGATYTLINYAKPDLYLSRTIMGWRLLPARLRFVELQELCFRGPQGR